MDLYILMEAQNPYTYQQTAIAFALNNNRQQTAMAQVLLQFVFYGFQPITNCNSACAIAVCHWPIIFVNFQKNYQILVQKNYQISQKN